MSAALATDSSTVYTCPAFDVVEPTRDADGHIALSHDDRFRCPDYNFAEFRIGSLRSYAIANGECPDEAEARAERCGGAAAGHVPVWISGCAVTLVSRDYERTRETFIAVAIGDTVAFEGKVYRIEKTWNRNLKLVEA